ncbi:MAG TPA: iron ABC transporter permease [Acidimicrobiales bacterium]|nr:iron ABC transporter permease [Acidimicrobiales bacterium]
MSAPGGGRLGRRATALLAAGPAAFLAVFFVLPVATIVGTGLRDEGRWNLGALADVLGDGDLRQVVWFTAWQAVVSTVATLAVGLPAAYVLARFAFPGRELVRAILSVPFVLPTVVVAVAFLALLPDDLTGTVAAMFIAHVFFNVAVVIRVVGGLLERTDPRLEEAAATLGASRWRAVREVTWPLARPAVWSAGGIVFLFSFTSFGVVLLLGDPARPTLDVEIYRQTALLLDLPTAAALSLVQLAVVGTLVAVGTRRQRRSVVEQPLTGAAVPGRRPRGVGERAVILGALGVALALVVAPLSVLVARSVRVGDQWSLAWYRALVEGGRSGPLLVTPIEAVRNSLLFAVAATVIAVAVGGLAAVVIARGSGPASRALDAALILPLGVSAVTIGFGFLVALDSPPLDLRGSTALVPIAQALVAVPFVVRTVVPVLVSIDRRVREAAAVLGASPARVWREVDLPLAGRALAAGAAFAFAISLGEFGATVFLARAQEPTVPVAILRLLGRPGAESLGTATALSVVLLVLTAASFLVIGRLRLPGTDR